MVKILLTASSLIALALGAGVYLHFSPAIPIFFIVCGGIFAIDRVNGWPKLWPGHVGWRSGHGIYLRGDDQWLSGSDSRLGDVDDSDDDESERR